MQVRNQVGDLSVHGIKINSVIRELFHAQVDIENISRSKRIIFPGVCQGSIRCLEDCLGKIYSREFNRHYVAGESWF